MRLQNRTNDVKECSHSERGNGQRQLSTKGFDTEEDEESRGDDLNNAYSENHIADLVRIQFNPLTVNTTSK